MTSCLDQSGRSVDVVVIATAVRELRTAVEALKRGAYTIDQAVRRRRHP